MAMAHYRESHPLAFVVTHYINLVAMILLICTGFIIHYPFAPFLSMGVCRGVHIFCGFVLVINVIVRVILAFVIDAAPTNGTRQLQKEYKIGNIRQRKNGLALRVVGDELPEEAVKVGDNIDLEDVYLYYFE